MASNTIGGPELASASAGALPEPIRGFTADINTAPSQREYERHTLCAEVILLLLNYYYFEYAKLA
jgi:hypothetical protein